MRAEPGLHAQICDLLGADPDAQAPALPDRPELALAVAGCGRGQVVPARCGAELLAVAVLPDGRCYVLPDRCPHDGQPLSDGFLESTRLVCPRHGWEFDLETGACPGRPRVTVAAVRLPVRS
jgi:nitrite reductase (NADH) small subunit